MYNKRVVKLVILLPVINILADVTVNYFRTGSNLLYHPGILRGIILFVFVLYFIFKHITTNRINLKIYLFLGYLSILLFFSSDIIHSLFSGYLKWTIALMMFPIGYYYINNEYLFRKIHVAYIWSMAIICISLIIAQIFKLGLSPYLEDSFYLGGAGVSVANSLSIMLLISPILLNKQFGLSKREKWFLILLISTSIILLLLSMKRSAIFGLLFGSVVFSYFSYRKAKIFKYVVFTFLIIVITFPYYEDIFITRFSARTTERNYIENESRYREIFFVLKEMENSSIKNILIGSELFNSQQYFGPKYFGRGRMIHGDFTSFLYGSGIIGIILYISIFIVLYIENKNIRKKIKNKFLIDVNAVFFAILAATFLISMTGSGSIGERSLVYLYLGAVYSIQKKYIYSLSRKKPEEKIKSLKTSNYKS